MLKLYYTFISADLNEIPESNLSEYRREKLLKQTNPRVRSRSAVSEALLRHALLQAGFPVVGPLDLREGEYGKPYLDNEECFFSLSHSADAVFCALSDTEIGADVQIRSDAKTALIRRYFREDERLFIEQSADKDDAFTEIWAKKESRCKQDGRGLALPLNSFSVFEETVAPFLWHTVIGEYHFAVCSETVSREMPDLTEFSASDLSL